MGFGKCVHSILAASLIFLSSTNVVAAVLPEYARLLSKPLVERKALPITFGLENELGCRLLHAVEVCALGIVATQFPALLPGTLAVLAQHPRHASWLSSRLTYRRLEKTVRQLGDPNLELDFRSFRYGPGELQYELRFKKENFTLAFKSDPNVLEVTTTPFTLEEYDRVLESKIAFGIFEQPSKTWVSPAIFLSGGHLNLGVESTFGKYGEDFDLVAYRNFLIDFTNHSELYHGALLYDPTVVAAKPHLSSPAERQKFQSKIAELDKKLAETTAPDQILKLKDEYDAVFKLFNFRKGYAINPQRDVIEIRSVRAQKNVEELRMLLELFQARAETLARVREPIPFLDVGPIRSYGQGLAQFKDYIVGSGLEWERYKKILPRFWRIHREDPSRAYVRNPGELPFLLKCSLFLLNR